MRIGCYHDGECSVLFAFLSYLFSFIVIKIKKRRVQGRTRTPDLSPTDDAILCTVYAKEPVPDLLPQGQNVRRVPYIDRDFFITPTKCSVCDLTLPGCIAQFVGTELVVILTLVIDCLFLIAHWVQQSQRSSAFADDFRWQSPPSNFGYSCAGVFFLLIVV